MRAKSKSNFSARSLARATGPLQPKCPSSAAKAARASCGSHEPGQAQGRKSTGLEPELGDVSARADVTTRRLQR
ncbi:hypothetical protein L3X38_001689 [Prunus dulcis]|uniref:Uncharacterized protein n=1 Tax=Prunus dulcis TaxID=3755 RepID=A0AAD4ZJ92_PRUDU|nr:hypothetical protein L3X38_001689 [Prunus dulcis]